MKVLIDLKVLRKELSRETAEDKGCFGKEDIRPWDYQCGACPYDAICQHIRND